MKQEEISQEIEQIERSSPTSQQELHHIFEGNMISALEDLVKSTLELEQQDIARGVSCVDVLHQLQELKKSISLLSEYQKQTMKALEEIAHEEGVELPTEEEVLSTEGNNKEIEKLQRLITVCESAQERLHAEMIQNPDIHDELTKSMKESRSTDSQKIRKRRNKFRSLGQDGWVSL